MASGWRDCGTEMYLGDSGGMEGWAVGVLRWRG